MEKVEFKKNFELGYQVVDFSANNAETLIRIKNSYSVPSSTVSSTITGIAGTLFEEKRWGLLFSDLIEIQSEINANVHIELDRYRVDIEDFMKKNFWIT